jgi:FkbM family methyltransferase
VISRGFSGSERRAHEEVLRRLQKILRLTAHRSYRRGLTKGVAAAVEHSAVTFQHAFGTVIDVGAHHGQFALFALRAFPHAHVWCVEPLPCARSRLEAVLGGHPRVRILPCAAGSRDGRLKLHVARATDLSSALPAARDRRRIVAGLDEVAQVDVEAVRLDKVIASDLLEPPSLLKVDAQGYELEVLEGAEGVLYHFDELLVECSFVGLYQAQPLVADVICYLHARSFDLVGVFGLVRDRSGRCVEADLLFARHDGF